MPFARPMLVSSLFALSALALPIGASAKGFTLTSPEFKAGGTLADEQVFNGFGCTGKNVSPALNWSGAPKGTKSFALLVHDPDAPTGGAGWWHWVTVNIPADATEIAKGAGTVDSTAMPKGSQQVATDFGVAAWGGPCPPIGNKPHRYNFTLYALKVAKLDLPAGVNAATAGFMVNANILAKTSLRGKFGRSK